MSAESTVGSLRQRVQCRLILLMLSYNGSAFYFSNGNRPTKDNERLCAFKKLCFPVPIGCRP